MYDKSILYLISRKYKSALICFLKILLRLLFTRVLHPLFSTTTILKRRVWVPFSSILCQRPFLQLLEEESTPSVDLDALPSAGCSYVL